MTEHGTSAARSARPATRRDPVRAIVWATLAAFLALLALLSARLLAGQDPALRARAAAAPLPPRRVLIRRVIERRVVVHLPPNQPAQPTRSSEAVASIGGSATPLLTRTS